MRKNPEVALELVLFVSAALFLLLGFTPSGGAAGEIAFDQKATGVLRVVTWNLGGSSGRNGHALSESALSQVAQTLAQLNADLVLVQELRDPEQLGRLRVALGDHDWQAVAVRSAGVRGREVAILARRGHLSGPPVQSNASLTALYSGSEWPSLMVANVHAHAYSAERRNRELGWLSRQLHHSARGTPVILGGDLNLDLDLDKRRDLFSDNAHRDVETYNYVAGQFLDAARGTGSTAEPDRRLDYIFVTPQEFEVVAAGPRRDRRVGDMDHDPLVADLRFTTF